ncbi:RDD family protein [Bacillus sp. PS06]|uniref:RDD family protein n=1 Tax=Bacillus sp. PS06 TaxID=2764176 RepID=UPI00177CDA68|nr:RDD family protein [Bacillus sp. PS06]MBD8068981.1 RDD family protein [Bacillus sp. PS06]
MDISYNNAHEQPENLVQSPNDAVYIQYAGFWMRLWAYLLDLIVVGSINRLIVYPIFKLIDLPLSGASMFAPISITTALTYFLYFVLMTKYFKQTLGKMVFGLKVITISREELTWGTVIFREFVGRFISKVTYIGYLIIAFLPKKQGIHDLFAETTVIHEHKELNKQS